MTPSVMRLPPATGSLPASQSAEPLAVSLPASLLSVAAQPASSSAQCSEPKARPVASMDRVGADSSIHHHITVPLQDHNASLINASFVHLHGVHALDPARSVQLFRYADHGYSSAVGALDFLPKCFPSWDEEFVALNQKYLAREERVISIESEVESLVQENHLLKNNIEKLKTGLTSHICEVSSLKSRIDSLKVQSSTIPAKLLSISQHCDWHQQFLGFLIHHFDALEASLCYVVTEAEAGRADIRRSADPLLSKFHEPPLAEYESP